MKTDYLLPSKEMPEQLLGQTVRLSAFKQQGATLFTALIFLIMLSLLGLNAAQMSGLEERMASNSRNRDLAFQAAEAALKVAAQNVPIYSASIPAPTNAVVTPVAGMRQINTCLPNSAAYWNNINTPDCTGTNIKFDWSGTDANGINNAMTLNSDDIKLPEISALPALVVERLPDSGASTVYRVTARGVGGTNSNAVVILQAMFSCTPTAGPPATTC